MSVSAARADARIVINEVLVLRVVRRIYVDEVDFPLVFLFQQKQGGEVVPLYKDVFLPCAAKTEFILSFC